MAVTNWMTSEEVRANAVKRTNFDTNVIDGNIYLCQVKYLKSFLGSDFYNEIHAQVVVDDISAENTLLLDDYLKYALAYFVLYESFWELNFKQTTKGSVMDYDELSNPVTSQQLDIKRNDFLDKANSWLDLAQDHIKTIQDSDSTKFPNYSVTLSDSSQDSFSHTYIPDTK